MCAAKCSAWLGIGTGSGQGLELGLMGRRLEAAGDGLGLRVRVGVVVGVRGSGGDAIPPVSQRRSDGHDRSTRDSIGRPRGSRAARNP